MTQTHWLLIALIPVWLLAQWFLPGLIRRYAVAHYKRIILLVVAVLAGPRIFLMVLPFYSLYFFLYEYKAAQAIADTPSSKIVSAAQGYVEINASGVRMQALKAPYSDTDCLWYSARKYKTNGWLSRVLNDRSRWKLLEESVSKKPFLVTDGQASCYVDPAGAQVSALDHREWFEGDLCCEEALFLADKPLYVLGDFRTASAADSAADLRQKIGALIRRWKEDESAFLKRFDSDGDGKISLEELGKVRDAAIQTLQILGVPQGPVSTIGKPESGRPFVISHHPQSSLVTAHKRHSYFYIVLGIASVLLWGKTLPRAAEGYDEADYPQGWPALQALVTYTCPDLHGIYSTRASGTGLGEVVLQEPIPLLDTVFGSVLRPQQAPALQPYWREWDTLSVLPADNLNFLRVVAARNENTMAAFSGALLAQAPEVHARWQRMLAPATRRSRAWDLVERNAGTINPSAMTDEQFENAIDDEYLGVRRHALMDKSGMGLNCGRGWAVRTLQEDGPVHKWRYVGVTRDVEGNLVAKEYYSERRAGSITGRAVFEDEVLRWTRWPKLGDVAPVAPPP